MIPELRDLSYESRLLQCGLTTLETRRLRGDQIEVFKIVNGYEDVDRNMFFLGAAVKHFVPFIIIIIIIIITQSSHATEVLTLFRSSHSPHTLPRF